MPTGSRPDVDARCSSWERLFLGTLVSRPHPWDAPFPGRPCRAPLRFDRTGFARANRFRSVKRPWIAGMSPAARARPVERTDDTRQLRGGYPERTNFWKHCGVNGARRSAAPEATVTSPT